MPITCICPQCQKTLAISEEFAGQAMRCPLCMALFQSPPLQGAPLPPITRAPNEMPSWIAEAGGDGPAAPAPASRKGEYDWGGVRNGSNRLGTGWHMVRRGLSLVPTSLLVVFIVLVASRAFLVLAAPEPKIEEMVLLIAIPLSIIGTIAAGLGMGMCVLVPKESKLRPLAVGAAACLLGCLLISLITFGIRVLLLKTQAKAELAPLAYLPGAILALAGSVLFLMFLRGVARHFENKRLAQAVLWCAIGLGASPVAFLFVWLLLYMTSAALGGDGSGLSILTAVVLYLFAAADLFWFLRVLRDVRRTVERAYLHAMA